MRFTKINLLRRADAIKLLDLPLEQRIFPQKELKKAYREKAKQYHPDAPDGDAEKFKRIGEAFELLSKNTTENATRRSGPRRKYDDFKFDDSDEEHRWAKMKKGYNKGEEREEEFNFKPTHHETPPSEVNQKYFHLIALTTSFIVILFRRQIFPESFFPQASYIEEMDKINEKYKKEHREVLEKAIQRRITEKSDLSGYLNK